MIADEARDAGMPAEAVMDLADSDEALEHPAARHPARRRGADQGVAGRASWSAIVPALEVREESGHGRQATSPSRSAGLTFLLTVIWGGPLIVVCGGCKIGKQIRIDGPETAPDEDGHAHNGWADDRGAGLC